MSGGHATADLVVVPPHMAASHRVAAWREWSGAASVSPAQYAAWCDPSGLRAEDVRQIDVDVPRTSAPSGAPSDRGAFSAALRRVLLAYSSWSGRPGAYTQGMNFLAAFLLEVAGPEQERAAFAIMCAVCDGVLAGYYSDGLRAFRQDCEATLLLAERQCPSMGMHAAACGLPIQVFLPKWMMCVFTTVLPFARCVRVWDALLCTAHCRGAARRVLVNLAVALLAAAEPAVLDLPADSPEMFNEALQAPGGRPLGSCRVASGRLC